MSWVGGKHGAMFENLNIIIHLDPECSHVENMFLYKCFWVSHNHPLESWDFSHAKYMQWMFNVSNIVINHLNGIQETDISVSPK